VVHDVGNTAARRRLGMPTEVGSCHTATVGGDVIEGHVPLARLASGPVPRVARIGAAA
jgi:hypothetical protein